MPATRCPECRGEQMVPDHYVGKATVNALEMASLLKGEPVKAPRSLVENYPELREFME